jgi:hypothetical protein
MPPRIALFEARAMAAAASASGDGNTLRDKSTHHLKELNARTAHLGVFAVSVFRPKLDTCQYKFFFSSLLDKKHRS